MLLPVASSSDSRLARAWVLQLTRGGGRDRKGLSGAYLLDLLSRWASLSLSKCPRSALCISLCLVSAWSIPATPPRFLAMLLSKALKILCFQTINYKPLSLPEMWEGRSLATVRPEEALDITQELLASWLNCPLRHLLSHFSYQLACKSSPNSSQGKKWKREERGTREREGGRKEIPKPWGDNNNSSYS